MLCYLMSVIAQTTPARTLDSLEEIRAHSPLSTIPLQTPYALIRSLLAWIEILAIRFAIALDQLQCAVSPQFGAVN